MTCSKTHISHFTRNLELTRQCLALVRDTKFKYRILLAPAHQHHETRSGIKCFSVDTRFKSSTQLQQIVQLTGPRCCIQRRGLESRSTLNYILCHWSPPRWWYDFGWTLQNCLTPSTRMSSFINWEILINWSSEYPCQIRKNNLEHMLWLLMREKLSCEHSSKLVLFRFLVNFILLWVSLS